MTDREKEIRDAERKAMAEVRRWKRNVNKRLNAMTSEERIVYWKEYADKLRAEGFNVVKSSSSRP